MEKIKVLVADDHPAFREGLCRLLEEEADLEVVARPGDGEETVRLAKELLPDVAIIDVAMPKLMGFEAARQIKAVCPEIAILMVSAFEYEAYLVASLQVGAAGYILKNVPVDELISAVRRVYRGEGVFAMKAISKVLGRVVANDGAERKILAALHRRELEILKLVAKGMRNREIGEELSISGRTVQTHMVNIFRKLGVGSRTEAVLHALREGWLVLDDLS